MVETLRPVLHCPSTTVFYSEVNFRSAHLNLEAAFFKNKSVLNLKCMLELVFSLVFCFCLCGLHLNCSVIIAWSDLGRDTEISVNSDSAT